MNLIYDPWTKDFAEKVYDTLVEHVGAKEVDRDGFVTAQTSRRVGEWRFIGTLGFGGKVYRGTRDRRVFVSYYPEDRNPVREEAMEKCNAALQKIVEEEVERQAREQKT